MNPWFHPAWLATRLSAARCGLLLVLSWGAVAWAQQPTIPITTLTTPPPGQGSSNPAPWAPVMTPRREIELLVHTPDGTKARYVGSTVTESLHDPVEYSWPWAHVEYVEATGVQRILENGSQWYILSDGPESMGLDSKGWGCPSGQCFASDGYYLVRGTVTGLGQIFSYHANHTSPAITLRHAILVSNPNNHPIRVTSWRNAVIDTHEPLDMKQATHEQWRRYFSPQPRSMVVGANSQAIFISHKVPTPSEGSDTVLFAITAEMAITLEDGRTPATATVVDLVWPWTEEMPTLDRDWGTQGTLAPEIGCCGRGVGQSSPSTARAYHPTVRLNTHRSSTGVITHNPVTTPTSPAQVYPLGLSCTSLNDATTLEMNREDPPPGQPWPTSLYGRILDVRWPIPNPGTTPITVRIAAVDFCPSSDAVVDFTVRYPTGNMARVPNVNHTEDSPIKLLDFYQATIAPGSVWDARFQVLVNGPGAGYVGLAAYVLN